MRSRFTHDTVEFFTQGECGALAVRLHELTGWPICGVRDGTGVAVDPALKLTRAWSHAMVRTPQGLYLDVTGARNAHDAKNHWVGQLVDRPRGASHDQVLHEIRDLWLSPHDEFTPQQRRDRTRAVACRVLTLYAHRSEPQDFVPAGWWTNNPELIGMDS